MTGPSVAQVLTWRPEALTELADQWDDAAGRLQADGYAGYDRLYATGRVIEVACWAHF